MKKIYLDVCCLNRPFDDQKQDRTRLESEAILLILAHFEAKEWIWYGSEVINIEIEKTPDIDRRIKVKMLASNIKIQ